MGRVQDKACVVTGAGSGIGKATALRLAAEGGKVVVSDINFGVPKKLLMRSKNQGAQLLPIRLMFQILSNVKI